MALSAQDHRSILKGFESSGYVCTQHAATSPANPINLRLKVGGIQIAFRLWVFEITHGGGGAAVRAADEFRIQITNGPSHTTSFDKGGYTDLLLGYSPGRDAIVAYDRRWLEIWTEREEASTSGGSPSVQVKEADILQGVTDGIHHLTKMTKLFGAADIVTMRPDYLPAYLLNHQQALSGAMNSTHLGTSLSVTKQTDIVEYCAARGFSFPPELIARYIAAFLTKPFVILAGVSGTGKSKLAELVAEYYSQKSVSGAPAAASPDTDIPAGQDVVFEEPSSGLAFDASRFALVAVRPDWIDNQSVLGFVNPITQTYESTQALDLILRAQAAWAASTEKSMSPRHFMLLDEMNLAKVEHYFSDWLACSESRRNLPDGSVSQQAIALHRSSEVLRAALQDNSNNDLTVVVPKSLALPTNLVVTGTVNVDETTYGISPKVLDRAMVLEFDEVNLDRLRGDVVDTGGGKFRFPEQLPAFRLATNLDYQSLPGATHDHLKAINDILEVARLHFGYRSAAEMARFMAIYNELLPELPAPNSDNDWLRALDLAILQKVLPRLQGNRAKLEGTLVGLCSYMRDLALGQDLSNTQFDRSSQAKLPKSYRRALDMLDALRDFGFVSFFK